MVGDKKVRQIRDSSNGVFSLKKIFFGFFYYCPNMSSNFLKLKLAP
jgi:hypothetical protein